MSEVLRYRGSRNEYLDIATRGGGVSAEGVSPPDEFLGISADYAIHPKGIGCLIIRFVVHGKGANPKNYKHLTYRESAQFVIPLFKGYRLNKIAIPVFQPPVKIGEVDKFAAKLNVWAQVEDFVVKTAQAEGFALTVENLQDEIRLMVIGLDTPEDAVKSVIEFPNLDAPEQQAFAGSQAQKPVDEDDDPDKEDDEDDDKPEKDWLN